PISVDALMQKVIAAWGGEENLRKHHSLVVKLDLALENQGMTGTSVITRVAPNRLAAEMTWTAAGKKVATIRDYFDGAKGGVESSLSADTVEKTGKLLADDRIEADFSPELNWKTLFKSVTIKRMAKVGEEEVYVVEKGPAEGDPIMDYISTRS